MEYLTLFVGIASGILMTLGVGYFIQWQGKRANKQTG